jgi:hypothetical protein
VHNAIVTRSIDQTGIGSDQLAAFALGEGNIQAVVDADAGQAGDAQGAEHQRHGREELPRIRHELHPELRRVGDDPAPLGFREGVGGLQGE